MDCCSYNIYKYFFSLKYINIFYSFWIKVGSGSGSNFFSAEPDPDPRENKFKSSSLLTAAALWPPSCPGCRGSSMHALLLRHYEHLPGSICPPTAKTLEDLRTHVFPMLRTLGPYAYRDPVLIIKILRSGSIKQNIS